MCKVRVIIMTRKKINRKGNRMFMDNYKRKQSEREIRDR